MEFGGLGGIMGGRAFDPDNLFEVAIERAFGERLRSAMSYEDGWYYDASNLSLGQRIWGSLANVDWTHKDGHTAGYSFRAAGDLIAAIIGRGDYMDWYCSAPSGQVDPEVAAELAKEGWTGKSSEWA